MSIQALDWAEAQKLGRAHYKVVLTKASKETPVKGCERELAHQCFVKHATIAKCGDVSTDTSQRAVDEL